MGRRPVLGAAAVAVAVLGTSLVGGGAVASPVVGAAPTVATAAPAVSRLAGPDRIGTAVRISQHGYPQPFESGGSVYLARSDVFADAVAAGALTDGPVLLVPSCGPAPQVVRDEVDRLKPARIVALGGYGAVCSALLREVAGEAYSTARLEGTDRYLTSLAIARERVRQGPVTEVYVASGLDSPDAVVGGQLTRGPILLTGTVDHSAEYKAFISELKPARVIALGGVGAVSAEQLNAIWGMTARLSGQSRYETAAAIAMREFSADATTVYLARADVYADAVAAGSLKDGPVLLVDSCSLPMAARERIAAAQPLRIIALGGPGAVCDAVLTQAAGVKAASGGRIVASQLDATGWATERGSVNAISSGGDWLLVSGYGLTPDASFGLVLQHRTTGEVHPVAGAGTKYEVDTDGARDLSGDGGQVVFETRTPVNESDTNGVEDIVVFDRPSGTWTVASRTPTGDVANGASSDPSISEDGTTVVFSSMASDLVEGDGNPYSDVFTAQWSTGKVALVSRTTEGTSGNEDSRDATVSGDGRYVAYTTAADDLYPDDTAGTRDLLRRDMVTGTVVRVNRQSACGWCSETPSISADGAVVAYTWPGEEVPGIVARADNVFVRDLSTGDVRLASFADGTESWARSGRSPAISANGKSVIFLTNDRLEWADDLNSPSVYMYDMALRTVTLLSRPYTGGATTAPGTAITWTPSITADGSAVSFVTDQPELVSYESSNRQSYLWERLEQR